MVPYPPPRAPTQQNMGGVKLLATLFGYCQLMPAGRPKSRVELQTAPTLWLSIAVGLGKMWQSGKLKGECWKTWGQGWENLRGKEKAKAGAKAVEAGADDGGYSTYLVGTWPAGQS